MSHPGPTLDYEPTSEPDESVPARDVARVVAKLAAAACVSAALLALLGLFCRAWIGPRY